IWPDDLPCIIAKMNLGQRFDALKRQPSEQRQGGIIRGWMEQPGLNISKISFKWQRMRDARPADHTHTILHDLNTILGLPQLRNHELFTHTREHFWMRAPLLPHPIHDSPRDLQREFAFPDPALNAF